MLLGMFVVLMVLMHSGIQEGSVTLSVKGVSNSIRLDSMSECLSLKSKINIVSVCEDKRIGG